MFLLILFLCILLCILLPRPAIACFTLVLGKKVSPTGAVLVGHNEDDGGRLCIRHGLITAQDWGKDTDLRFEDCSARVPQVEKTHGFFWTEVLGEKGLSGSDCFYNDAGVMVVSNSGSVSRRDNEPDFIGGGIEYALRRAIAERAASAEEGVDVAVSLLDRYGYRGWGRIYTVADADEAWMIQVVRGRSWCAVRVADDEAAIMPNHFTVHAGDFKNRPHKISALLIENAIKHGWYVPQEPGNFDDFDFARAYQDPQSWCQMGNLLRHRHTFKKLTNKEMSPDESFPFAVKPGRTITIAEVKSILRDHYEGTTDYTLSEFAGGSPHFTKSRRICTGTTVESVIARLDKEPKQAVLYIAAGRPCCQPYQPLSLGVMELPDELGPMADAAELTHHCERRTELLDVSERGWGRISQDETIIDLHYGELHPLFTEWIRQREKEMESEFHVLSDRVQKMRVHGDTILADQVLTSGTAEIFRETARQKAGLLRTFAPSSLETDKTEMTKNDPVAVLKVSFSLPNRMVSADSVRMGPGGLNPTLWAAPLPNSLKQTDHTFSLKFKVRELTCCAVTCCAEFWLAGKDSAGLPFAGRCLLTVLPAEA